MGCLAQDLAEHIDAEGPSVAAADAEDEWREVEGRVHVQGLAQQLPGVFTRTGPAQSAQRITINGSRPGYRTDWRTAS
ncbi:hypothetical protein SDIAM26S_05724 [Streptomyces diastaticus subsp. diastaticus]